MSDKCPLHGDRPAPYGRTPRGQRLASAEKEAINCIAVRAVGGSMRINSPIPRRRTDAKNRRPEIADDSPVLDSLVFTAGQSPGPMPRSCQLATMARR